MRNLDRACFIEGGSLLRVTGFLLLAILLTVVNTAFAQTGVNDRTTVSFSRAQFNRRTSVSSYDVTIANTSTQSLYAPLRAIVMNISSPTVTVANADGTTTPADDPYFDYSSLLPNGELLAGQSVTKRWEFNNPSRARFTFDVDVEAVLTGLSVTAQANLTSGYFPLAVVFSATTTGAIVNYEWDFDGDGTYDSSSTVTADAAHTYTMVGTYNATIRVTDSTGATATSSVDITAENPIRALPQAYPTAGSAPLTVRFVCGGTDATGTITFYEYDFDGDGEYDWTSDTPNNVNYRYNQPGVYSATLRIRDNHGLSDTASVTIAVDAGEQLLSLDANPPSGPAPLDVIFTTKGAQPGLVVPIFQDDMEGGGYGPFLDWWPEPEPDWNDPFADGWHHIDYEGHSSDSSWQCNLDPDSAVLEHSLISMTPIPLFEARSPIRLSFWHTLWVSDGCAYVDISEDGGFSWTTISSYQEDVYDWARSDIDLSPYYDDELGPPELFLRFRLAIELSGDAYWSIDDVSVTGSGVYYEYDFYGVEPTPSPSDFFDDVENGIGDWTPEGNWGITTDTYYSSHHCWTDSPGENYGNDVNASLTSQTIVLPDDGSPELSFWQRYSLESGFDSCYVEISTDGGSNWTTLASYTGTALDWHNAVIALSGYSGNAQIRFRLESDYIIVYDGWYIDDISIVGYGYYGSYSTTHFEFMQSDFFDDVENGMGDWTPEGNWGLTADTYHSSHYCWADSPGGNYSGGVNSSLTSRTFVLPDDGSPVLSFWHRYALEEGYDFGYVEISTDGGSDWTTLASYTGAALDWYNAVVDLSGYSGYAQIRFRLETDFNVVYDGWYIDDISIIGSGVYANTVWYQYSSPGTYNPSVRVTDALGVSTASTTVVVQEQGVPSVTATGSVLVGDAPLTISFTGSASSTNGDITLYEWDFDGDGTYDWSSTASPDASHTYNDGGTFDATLKVTDVTGATNSAVVTVEVDVDIFLSVSAESFKPDEEEAVTVTTTYSGGALISLVVKNKAGDIARTLVSDIQRQAGTYSDIWDGKDEQGDVAAHGVYYFAVYAELMGGRTTTCDLTYITGGQYFPYGDFNSNFDSLEDQFCTISYTLTSASEVTAFIAPFGYLDPSTGLGYGGERVRTIVADIPQVAGTHTLIWDGTDDNGCLLGRYVSPYPDTVGGGYLVAVLAWDLPDNAVVVEKDVPVISDVSAEPNYLDPSPLGRDDLSTGRTTTVSYNLSKPADITLSIYNMSGVAVRTNTEHNIPEGSNTISWDGKNDDGIFVKDGQYRLALMAKDDQGNQSMIMNAFVVVFY